MAQPEIPDVGQLAGICGYDATGPHKLGVLISYYGELQNQKLNVSHAAGNFTLDSDVVPAGYLWVVNAAAAENFSGASTSIELKVYPSAGYNIQLDYRAAPAVYVAARFAGQLVLSPGAKLHADFIGVALNDNIQLNLMGFIMKVDPYP